MVGGQVEPENNLLTGNIPLRLDILVKVRFHECEPLLDAAFDVPASLADVTEDLLAPQVSSLIVNTNVASTHVVSRGKGHFQPQRRF